MALQAGYEKLPFDEAIGFFRQKVNLPTEDWRAIERGMHSRAFVIAGATGEDLLSDFRKSVDKAIAEGTTLEEFRKDFDDIVARHGWSYNGARGWRSNVIYRTNLRSAYNAGRFEQMNHPDVIEARPYRLYRHGDSFQPRPLHLSWDGLVLHYTDPWLVTHATPNGWGCDCIILAISGDDLQAMGKDGPDSAPEDGTYEWVDKKTGEVHTFPKGVDPFWDYSPGRAAWGDPVAESVLREERGGRWRDLSTKGPPDFGRPDRVPVDPARAQLAPEARDEAAMARTFRDAIGGEQAVFSDPSGGRVLVNHKVVEHILESGTRLDGRERYFPLIRETIEDPFEVWAGFAENERTGKVAVRRRYVKMVDTGKGDRSTGLVAEVVDRVWTGFTFFRGRRSALKNLRRGTLVWGR